MAGVDSATLNSLPLPPSALAMLAAGGFVTVGDLDGLSPAELASELDSTPDAAARLLVEVRSGGLGGAAAASSRSALDLLKEERSAGCLVTFVPELDALLGGGVPLRRITEFAGVPGVGKTQLAMQLALDARIPAAFHGLDGESVYIDTEGSFMAERALQMAGGLVHHLRFMAARDRCVEQLAVGESLEPRALLDGIHYFRVHDAAEQLAAVRALPALVAARPIRAIIVDSIAFHFRYGEADYGKRQQLLSQMGAALSELATRCNLAVVLINHVTTAFREAGGGANGAALVPALGESWAHMCHMQLLLQWHGGERHATLYKGRTPGSAAYRVTEDGVRSVAAAAGAPAAGTPAGAAGRGLKRPQIGDW